MYKQIVVKILQYFKACYQLDMRALAFMRIGVALLVIIDLWIRCSDLQAHYTDSGVMPISILKQYGWKPYFWSIHTFSSGLAWQVFVFGIHFLLAFCLLFGIRTKWITPLLWLLEISLHNRNNFILQSGDDLLRLVLFWGIFLPWGNCYTYKNETPHFKKQHFSVAGIGYLLLIASVYFFTVNLKTSSEWRADGTAIYFALSLDQIRLPLGDVLYNYPELMKALTHAVYYMELFIPFLILLPFRNQAPRVLAFVLLVCLHIGIGLTLYIGLFYLINIVTAIGFLPASFFDKFKIPFRFATLKKVSIQSWQKQTVFYISAIVIVLSMIINLSYCRWFSFELKKELWYPINALRLDQYWGMFSPNVLKEDGWFVYRGFDKNEKEMDAYNNTSSLEILKKPKRIVSMYSSDRWRKFAENYQSPVRGYLHEPYCKWYLKQWNEAHPENKLERLEIIYVEEFSLDNYQTKPLTQRLCSSCTYE